MARFDGGWIKIWRKAIDSDLFGNAYLWAIWHWLLCAATWKPSKILWNGQQKEIPPGTVVFSPRELAERWDCSRSVIQKWLHYLHDTGRIVLTTSPRGSIVTICNWELYQAAELDDPIEHDNGVITATQRRDNGEALSEEGKKEEVDPNPKLDLGSLRCIPELTGDVASEEILKTVSLECQRSWLKIYGDATWIKREVLKAIAYTASNPRKKPKKSWAKYLGGWLSRGAEWERKRAPAGPAINTTPIKIEGVE